VERERPQLCLKGCAFGSLPERKDIAEHSRRIFLDAFGRLLAPSLRASQAPER